eukprot:1576455-Alexandrium_andersonii.AAC.1
MLQTAWVVLQHAATNGPGLAGECCRPLRAASEAVRALAARSALITPTALANWDSRLHCFLHGAEL